ncbi:MAG: hypothetical protein KatS3mg003_1545 [Candidatus Nitrosocaldaceae archaeon]|nr:MAG: hypothetical protein KatS3mg003_1545 [Candidatus Nitrosocaldaceae archaeon]
MRVLQIATYGEDQEGITLGIKNFPIHKLILLCYEDDRKRAEEFGRRISSTLSIPVNYLNVSENNVIKDTLEKIASILKEENEFDQILINVSSGEKLIGCAALSAAFVNGIQAFGMSKNYTPLIMPVLKMSYSEIVSDAKIDILKAIDNAGGEVESLEALSNVSKYGKPLLSYHIQGSKESKGLAELGLVEVERISRGKVKVRITTLGKLLISTSR